MTDVPWWVLGPYAGLAGSILFLALWSFRLRRSFAEKGWKHTSRVFVLFPIYVLTDSVLFLLVGQHVIDIGRTETALHYTFGTLIWIILAMMVAGMMLDAVRNMRNHPGAAAHNASERE
jgi:hypothetical protein